MLKNTEKAKRFLKTSLTVLIILTAAFILIQSCLPPAVSGEESAAVSGFLASILPSGTWIYTFVTENVRKLAHFFEYGALGMELAVYTVAFVDRKRLAFIILPLCGLLFGFIDETVQIFSNRGPLISDVWLDAAGFSVFLYATLGAVCAFFALSITVFCAGRSY